MLAEIAILPMRAGTFILNPAILFPQPYSVGMRTRDPRSKHVIGYLHPADGGAVEALLAARKDSGAGKFFQFGGG